MNTAHPALFIIFPSCPCTQYYIQGPFFFGINYETQPMQSTCFLISSQSYWICLLRREGCWVRLGLWSGTSSTFHLVRWTDAGIDWSCSGSLESLTLAHRKLFFLTFAHFLGLFQHSVYSLSLVMIALLLSKLFPAEFSSYLFPGSFLTIRILNGLIIFNIGLQQ